MRRRRSLYTRVEEPADVVVAIPYTKPTTTVQTVIDCLRAQGVQPVLYKVGNDDRYWRMLRDLWAAGRGFFVVEQDVLVWHGAIRQMHECEASRGWCTLPTVCHGRRITTTLGCVRFSAQLIERNPGFWDDIEPTWFHLDAHFSDKMGWPYIKPHTHWPMAMHLNEGQWSDELSTRYTMKRKLMWQSREHGGDPIVRVTTHLDSDPRGVDRVVAANVERHE